MQRSRLTVVLWAAAVAFGAADGASAQEPSSRLNPARAHIELLLEGHVPRLKFFATSVRTGHPVAELNENGLFLRGHLICSWPGGHFDRNNWDSMVLGYVDQAATIYRSCPLGTPVRSFWYDEYGRHSRLYIEIAQRTGALIRASCGEGDCYFDLHDLPGNSRQHMTSVSAKPNDTTGWAWWESQRDSDRRNRQVQAALRRDRALQTFLRDAQRCLKSSAVPACFAAFVKPKIYYPEANIGIGYLTPDQFVDALWQSGHWDDLVACFVSAKGDSTRLEESGWICDLEKTPKGWRLDQFFQGN